MSEILQGAIPVRYQRRATSRLRRRRGDLWIATTALSAAMLALPLGQNSWNGPEVAAVLAVSATAMLAHHRWAIALVVLCELLLLPTLVPRAFVPGDLTVQLSGLVAVGALVPGMLSMRRAAAALVLISGWRRTQASCRRAQVGMVAVGALVTLLPFL